ncbi:MAG: hypothetical protein WBA91_10095 [Paracoccaceae bacterium]
MRRRKIFYLPGFDPFPPRRYRELYRREFALQAEFSGHSFQQSAARGTPNGWHVAATVEGQAVSAEFEVLVWSDLVKASMGQGIGATYWQLFRTCRTYFGAGSFRRLMGLRKGPMIAALFPVVILLAELMFALGVAATSLWFTRSLRGVPALVAWPLALAVLWGVLWLFRKGDGRLFAWYLIHDYAFTASCGGAYPPPLAERLQQFAAQIGAALDGAYDEVLVVGHSTGAHLAISALATLCRDRGGADGRVGGPTLSLLTLGHVVPMVSYLPKADQLRADLALVAESPALNWVDVTAPGDGCTFALCDPVAVSGMAGPDTRGPLVLSAAFSRTLSPALFRRLRRRYFRLHFQYLCAFDNLSGRPDDYDYFAVTAGPLTLWQRFGRRKPSASRITRPQNPHGAAT